MIYDDKNVIRFTQVNILLKKRFQEAYMRVAFEVSGRTLLVLCSAEVLI